MPERSWEGGSGPESALAARAVPIIAGLLLAGGAVLGVILSRSSRREGPVRLVPTDGNLRSQCQRAADLLDFAVPCPTRLPETSKPVRCELPNAFSGSDVRPKEGCALGEGFILEPKSMLEPALDHLVITASRGLEGEDCEGNQPARARTVRGHPAELIQCPQWAGLHANHDLLRWSVDGISVAVSVHGNTETNRELIEDIASGIEWIRPSA